MKNQGTFIVIEGPDGSGKSTQAARLGDYLSETGHAVQTVREPGGTPLGEAVRTILLDVVHTGMGRRAELMLYMACRAELVEKIIRPALERGEVVISDRFLTSSVAYQGHAGGLGRDAVLDAGRVAVGDVTADLTIILDVPVEVSRERTGRDRDRMEAHSDAFHEAVRRGYLAEAEGTPNAVVIDGTRPPEVVFEDIKKHVDHVLKKTPRTI